ncbi:MAG: alanine dehydrogenase [Cytophagales bacterium]|nr:alanine dehydrogenase [Cytophagales bacterium]MCA6369556.1 alanine dehydrogenase [Cytophagales bacterium]MCA6370730.1 alanine dehydrogenase [Cytophagales bacterium]MCA6377088.1 alanine dehydrogenase [Cytophagales bacterium]MCA6383741.1 alanine dehydrogenase [Cytophagales bacterium]
MNTIKLALISEGKIPPDKRVPFTPLQAEEIMQRFPHVKMVCQPCTARCFKEAEYEELGISVQEDVSNCDILMGIKEVPIQHLIANKTYLFFSHTLKKQPYNRKLLQEILKKQIRLIDYETLKDQQGNRLVAFGRYAGIVGAYNGLWAYGKKYKLFTLRRANECFDVNDLKLQLRKIKLHPIKIVLTGAGRVGKGAMETLDTAGIRKVDPADFMNSTFQEPVYTQLSSADYHLRIEGGHFNRDEFHKHPEKYTSHFSPFTKVADILLAGAFWNPAAPKLFTQEDMRENHFRIRVVADITCDINGSVPCTKRASTITDPVYDYIPQNDAVVEPLSGDSHITVMAVDNLPCELPRSASDEFGRDLIDRIMNPLLVEDTEGIIARATMAENGRLTSNFSYLQDYVDQK